MDNGTSGAAELFASALSGNQRADLVGEHTIGRAGVQKLVKLPGGSGLWLTTVRYLTPAGDAPAREGTGAHRRRSRRRTSSSDSLPRRPTSCSTRRLSRSSLLRPPAARVARATPPTPVWLAEKKAA